MGQPIPKRLNTDRSGFNLGILWASVGAVLGLIIWMLAWHAGLLQSASAFTVSWLAVLAYQKVTRTVPKKDRGYFWVLLIVIVVIFFGFFGGVVLDCTSIFSQQFGVSRIEALMAADFWHTVLANVKNIDYWGQYYSSMLLAAFFGGLGLSGLAKQLMGTNNK